MSRVSIGTDDGFGLREVVFDLDTLLDVRIQLDGIDAVVSTASCILARGSDTHVMSVSSSDGRATTTVTPAILSDIGGHLGDQIMASWTVEIEDGSPSNLIVERYTEMIWVSTQRVIPSLQHNQITSHYAELGNANALPSGQTSWWNQARDAWRELRNWSSLQGSDRQIWMIKNPQALRDLHFHWTMQKISMYQAARLKGSDIWVARATYHGKEIEKLKQSLMAYFEKQPISTYGQQPVTDRMTLSPPRFMTGTSSRRDVGKL